MKKLIVAAMLLTAGIFSGHAATDAKAYNTLMINRADGVTERLALMPSISIYATADIIRLTGTKITLEYALDEVADFTFDNTKFNDGQIYDGTHEKVKNAIEDVEAPGHDIIIGEESISASQVMTVYNLKGVEVARGKEVGLNSLPKGVYIVKIGNTALKIKL